jgi:flagellar basal-body rod protein FlgB
MGSLPMMKTSAQHMTAPGGTESFGQDRKAGFQTRPAGNAVNLEDEMLKVASNQGSYAAATALYTRSLGVLKTAIGKR